MLRQPPKKPKKQTTVICAFSVKSKISVISISKLRNGKLHTFVWFEACLQSGPFSIEESASVAQKLTIMTNLEPSQSAKNLLLSLVC